MARRIYRSILLHEAISGLSSEVGGHVIDVGSLDAGMNVPILWNQQQLGNGHKVQRTGDASGGILGWLRVPPRAWGSVLAGHGGKMGSPDWPVGRVWTGMNALGGYRRLRYRFRCAVGVYSGDTLVWGPVSIGLRMSANGLEVSNTITGMEFFVGQRTGDGSLFPNPGLDGGWKFAYRTSAGGNRSESSAKLGKAEEMHFIELAYVDSPTPVLRAKLDNFTIFWDGNDFDPSDPATNNTYGPAIEGRAVTACAVLEIHELAEGEDPFGDPSPKAIITSTGITVRATTDYPLITAGVV